MKTITVYKCDYCGKIRRTLKGIVNHEVQCYKNPDSLNCYLCENAEIDTVYSYDGYDTGRNGPCCQYNEEEINENIASRCDKYINCHKTIYERLRNEVEAKYE
jgi:hypothetical protein